MIDQDNTFTQGRISTIIVVIIISNIQLAEAPGNVLISCAVSNLSRDSVANVSQIFTVDKTFLVERIGAVPDYLQEEVDEDLRTVLLSLTVQAKQLLERPTRPSLRRLNDCLRST